MRAGCWGYDEGAADKRKDRRKHPPRIFSFNGGGTSAAPEGVTISLHPAARRPQGSGAEISAKSKGRGYEKIKICRNLHSAGGRREGKRIMQMKQAADIIKSRIDCRQFLTKSKSGLYVCPFCGSGEGANHTGALKWYDTNTWYCHVCKKSGDCIDLYMNQTGSTFADAIRELAQQAGITEDISFTGSTAAEDFKDMAEELAKSGLIVRDAVQITPAPAEAQEEEPAEPAQPAQDCRPYYSECVKRITDPAAVAYLEKRGISLETARAAFVGFDPAADPANAPGGIGEIKHPCPRIILPTTSAHYVGRSIDPDTPPAYSKMNNKGAKPGIFNRRALDDNSVVYVCEGAFDALSVMETGQAAIALNSTSNAELLLKKLEQKPTTATLVLCLDTDEAGKKATETLKEGLRRLNVSFLTANISGSHKDPNEALTADKTAFEAAVSAAISPKPDNVSLYIDSIMGDDIARRKEIGKKPTGFKNLDEQTKGGLRPGLFLLGAISSLGKTTFCSQLADGMAENGADVIYFSLEQSRLEMVSKSLSRESYLIDPDRAVTGQAIMDGFLPDIVIEAARNYKKKVADRVSIIEAGFNCDTQFITEYVRNYYQKTGKRPVVIIDYLQVLKTGEIANRRGQQTREIVEECISQLVLLKRELDLTIITIVSLNRSNYLQPFDFESIKETGLAEYSGDVVWGLQLQCLDDPLFNSGDTKLKEKREKIKEAKAEIPRRVKLVSVKHRGQQAIYDCSFKYFPQYDLFIPDESETSTAGQPPKAARAFKSGGKR